MPTSTAYDWAKYPDVRRQADDCRRRYFDRTLGWLSVHSMWAVKGMKHSGNRPSPSRFSSARRTVLHDLIKVSYYANLEYRLAELEEELRAVKQTRVTRLRARPEPTVTVTDPWRSPSAGGCWTLAGGHATIIGVVSRLGEKSRGLADETRATHLIRAL